MPEHYLYPNATVLNPDTGAAWGVGGAATAHEALDDQPWDSPSAADGQITLGASAGRILLSGPGMPAATTISNVRVGLYGYVFTAGSASVRPYLKFGSNRYSATGGIATVNPTFTHVTFDWDKNPDTLGSWTKGDVDALQFGVERSTSTGPNVAVVSLYVRVTYVKAPVGFEAARNVLARVLRLFRKEVPIYTVGGPLSLADYEIGTRLRLAAAQAPQVLGAGWGAGSDARSVIVVGSEIAAQEHAVTLTCFDERDFLTRLWDEMRSDEKPSALGGGVPRLALGSGRSFVRDSSAYIELPAAEEAGVARIVECPRDVDKVGYRGTLFEDARTQLSLRPCFISGTTGLTNGGTGVNGSAIALDTADLLLDPDITPNSLKLTAGNPHTAELYTQEPDTSSIPANSLVCVSTDHKESAGETTYVRIQRLVDNFYLTSGLTWQAGSTEIALPTRTALDLTQRDTIGPFDVGSSATALRIRRLLPSGGTASRVHRIYHMQGEVGLWPSSRIVTDGSEYTTDADDLEWDNATGVEVIEAARYTVRPFTWDPIFNGSDIPNGTYFFLLDAFWDSNNLIRLFVQRAGGVDSIIFRIRTGGTNYDATKVITVTKGTPIRFAARFISSQGELGLSPYTASVFVNGAKGTDAVASAPPTPTASGTLYVGRAFSNSSYAHGWIAGLDISPFCLTDEEIAGESAA